MVAADRTLKSLANRLLDLDAKMQTNAENMIDADTHGFVERMKNKNTVHKTKADLNRAKIWLGGIGETRELYDIPPEELNLLLARMFLNIRKVKDNNEYEPDTIRGMQSRISRHLTDNNYQGGDILRDPQSKHSREVISSKRKYLKGQGLGYKKRRCDPFTDDEIQIIREKKLIGADSPLALMNSAWLNNTTHFGLRGRQEHLSSMLWGDLELGITSTGREYVAFTERSTKTRSGVDTDPRDFIPKMFAQPDDEYCPVKLYKLYSEKRPEGTCSPESRFYLSLNPRYGQDGDNQYPWFIKLPMGKNKLGAIAKKMAKDAGLEGRHTNHSGRKTFVTKLLNNNVAPTDVARLSGHKNLMSLNSYNTVGINKQIEMPNIIHSVSHHGNENANQKNCAAENTESDEELLVASQETENAAYESNVKIEQIGQVIDLPVVHNADGFLSIQESKRSFEPGSIFANCNFQCPVNIVFK